jgi:hypothetical protein
MKSTEYRDTIKTIVRNVLRKSFPGLKKPELEEALKTIAKNIHARMYGADVDKVKSPLWRDAINEGHPVITATELLELD